MGGAGGGGAELIPEGPGESEEMRCITVNRHVGREGEKQLLSVATSSGWRLEDTTHSTYLLSTGMHTPCCIAPSARTSYTRQ